MSGEEYLLSLLHKKPEPNHSDAIYINQRACPFIKYFKDRLTVEYLGKGLVYNDITSIQSNKPANRDTLIFYYELKIVSTGTRGSDICIGFADADFPLNKHPGWTKKSYGYKSDGKVYSNKQAGSMTLPKFSTGDIVGCGINYFKREIFFTYNGTYQGPAFKEIDLKEYYATISLHSLNERVTFNFGSKPFKFDLDKLLLDEKRDSVKSILKQPINHYSLHQIVHSYLNFHGYANTLEAFEKSAQIERKDVGLPRHEIFEEPAGEKGQKMEEDFEDGEAQGQKLKRKKTDGEMEIEMNKDVQNGSNRNGQNHFEDEHDQLEQDRRYRSESMRIEFQSPSFNGIKYSFPSDIESAGLINENSNSQSRDFVLFKKASFCLDHNGKALTSGELSSQIGNNMVIDNQTLTKNTNEELKPNTYLLHERAQLRQLLLQGKVQEVMSYINMIFPTLFDESKELLKALHAQQFIEFIKLKDFSKAISYAQKYLTIYQKETVYCLDDQLVAQEVPIDRMMALLCYPEPENSDLKNFLGDEQRDLTADIVNKEILRKMGFIDQSILDIIIAQLTQMEETYREHNSYYGEVFKFRV